MSKSAWLKDGDSYKGKCTSAKKRCPVMRMAVNRTTRGPGLDTGMLIDLPTGKCRAVIVYRKTAAEPGVVVNFCPFCGGNALPAEKAPKSPAPKKAAAKTRARAAR